MADRAMLATAAALRVRGVAELRLDFAYRDKAPGRRDRRRCSTLARIGKAGLMQVPSRVPRCVLTALVILLLAGTARSAEIRVFSGGAPQAALQHLAPEFERVTGHRLRFTFQRVTEIQRKLAAGGKADVILLPVPLIAATEKNLPLRSEGRIVLARLGIGAIVRQGTTPPDISTAEAVRKMLLGARAIAWADPSTPVGGHLDRTIAQLGIAHEVRPKLIIKAAIHGGAELVAKGDADFGLYLVSEVQAAK